MSDLLYVIGSPRKGASESSAIADAYLQEYRRQFPDAEVDVLDLWTDDLPQFDASGASAKMTVFSGQQVTGSEADAWEAVEATFRRFNAADAYLFTVPMWNGGVPWPLKLYIDIITQPGMLFGFDPTAGYNGLITGRKATVIYTSAVYSPGVASAFGNDFHSTYFNDWLNFIGITDVEEIRFQPTVLTATPDQARLDAHARARRLAAGATPKDAAA